jgi:hypothetical protein
MNILITQYLENPLLDRLQTLWTSTSWKVDDHYWFWGQESTGHMNILTTQYLYIPFLDRHQTLYTVHLKELLTLWVLRSKVKLDITAQYLNPLLDGYHFVHWYIVIRRWPLLILRFKGQTGHLNILTTQYLENLLLDGIKLDTLIHLKK